jgi:spore coat protein SA
VKAFEEASRTSSRLRLLLVGTGSEYGAIASAVRANGLIGKVMLVGHVDHKNLPLYYSASDVMVVPSKYESFSIVTLEAMSCSLPIIASNRGYLPDLVRNGINGLLIDPEDVSSLSKALLTVAGDDNLRLSMGLKNREMVIREYTWAAKAEEYVKLFRAIESN